MKQLKENRSRNLSEKNGGNYKLIAGKVLHTLLVVLAMLISFTPSPVGAQSTTNSSADFAIVEPGKVEQGEENSLIEIEVDLINNGPDAATSPSIVMFPGERSRLISAILTSGTQTIELSSATTEFPVVESPLYDSVLSAFPVRIDSGASMTLKMVVRGDYAFVSGDCSNDSDLSNNFIEFGPLSRNYDLYATTNFKNTDSETTSDVNFGFVKQPFVIETNIVNIGTTTVKSVEFDLDVDSRFFMSSSLAELTSGTASGIVQNGTNFKVESMDPSAIFKVSLVGQTEQAGSLDFDTSLKWTTPGQKLDGLRNAAIQFNILDAEEADVAVSLSPSELTVEHGNNVSFNMSVTNNGPGDADNIQLFLFNSPDRFGKIHAVSIESEGISFPFNETPSVNMVYPNTLQAGATKEFKITINPSKIGVQQLTVGLFGIDQSDYVDLNESNNRATIDLTVTGSPIVTSLKISPEKIQVGKFFVASMTVTNPGPNDLTSLTMRALGNWYGFGPYSINLELYSIEEQGQWETRIDGPYLVGELGGLVAGESTTITAIYRIGGNPRPENDFPFEFNVSSPNHAPVFARQILPISDETDSGSDLYITRSVNPDPGVVNQDLTYTVRAINLGPDATDSGYIGNILPKDVTLTTATTDNGIMDIHGKYIDVSSIALDVGESATLTLKVVPIKSGTITNLSGLSSANFDPDLGNNVTSADTMIMETPECIEAVDLSAQLDKIRTKGKFKKKTGEWQYKVNTRVLISNNGGECAPPTVVKLYLSDDAVIDDSDLLLDTKSVKTVCPGKKPKKVKFKVKLGDDHNPVGRYLIAIADGDHTVPECNEDNNMAAGF